MLNKYIIELDLLEQEEIRVEVLKYLKKEYDLTESELEEEVELALSGRVGDLSEIIELSKWKK